MAKISDSTLYDIDRLVEMWESGWETLDKFVRLYHTIGYQPGWFTNSCCPAFRIKEDFDEVYGDMVSEQDIPPGVSWDTDELLTLAAIPKGKLYSSESKIEYFAYPEDETKLRQLLKRVITAFVSSKTLGDALYKINEENQQRFAEYWFDSKTKGWIDDLLSVKIDGRWVEAMRWLSYGLRGEKAFNEARWNCVWLYADPTVQEMLKIKTYINRDIPLSNYQHGILNKHIMLGFPEITEIFHKTGKEEIGQTFEIFLEPDFDKIKGSSLSGVAKTLLIRPAFLLAQQLQNKCSRPQFIRQCRAPSCGKNFYTRRKNAVVCPSKTPGKTSDCRLEWFRYRRYLKNLGKDPAKDWNNPSLVEYYLHPHS